MNRATNQELRNENKFLWTLLIIHIIIDIVVYTNQ